jgi:hypothetical protein
MSLTGNGEDTDILIATEDTYYGPEATTSFNAIIDLGTAQAHDMVAILGANLNGVNLEVRASTDNFAASDVSISTGSALTSDVNAAYRQFTTGTYRYWKFLFSGHPSNLRIAHICLMTAQVIPYFETDPDIRNFKPTAKQLISQAGIYIGANQQKSMREMSLDWGEVTASELATVQAFAEACIKTVNPFFFVPDIAETDCFFGWIPDGGQFTSPETPGVYEIGSLTFETRAV